MTYRIHRSGISADRYVLIKEASPPKLPAYFLYIPPSGEIEELEELHGDLVTGPLSIDTLQEALVEWRRAQAEADPIIREPWVACPGGVAVPIPVVRKLRLPDLSVRYSVLAGHESVSAILTLGHTGDVPVLFVIRDIG